MKFKLNGEKRLKEEMRKRVWGRVVALVLFWACCCSFAQGEDATVSFEGYKILRLRPNTDADAAIIHALPSLDVHKGQIQKGITAEAMVSHQDFQNLRDSLPSLAIEVIVENVQTLLDDHKRELDAVEDRLYKKRDTPPTEAFFDTYRTLAEVDTYITCTH